MFSDFVKVIDRKQWARDEMLRLVNEGVLEVLSIPSPKQRRKQKPQPSKAVYLMRAGDSYKIGYAGDPAQRRCDIQVGCPVHVEILHTVISLDYKRIERKLHHAFAQYRTTGEWFILDAATAARAIELMTTLVSTPVLNSPTSKLSAALATCRIA